MTWLTQWHSEGPPEPAVSPFLESQKARQNPQNPVTGNLFLGLLYPTIHCIYADEHDLARDFLSSCVIFSLAFIDTCRGS